MIAKLYILTSSLLVTHQIDAAYWREWEMFNLPGGIQFFDLFNLAVVPILLLGLRAVVLNRKSGLNYCLFASTLGLATLLIHLGFALAGFKQFNLPISVTIIGACGVCGLALLVATLRSGRTVAAKT